MDNYFQFQAGISSILERKNNYTSSSTIMNFYVVGNHIGSSIEVVPNRRFAQMVVTYWKSCARHLGELPVLSNLDARTDSVFYNIKFNNVSSG